MPLFLAGLVPKLKPMESADPANTPTEPVTLYTAALCAYCSSAKRLLQKLAIPFREVDLTQDHDLRERLSRENGDYRTVPMVFVEGRFVGGYTELSALANKGGLSHLT